MARNKARKASAATVNNSTDAQAPEVTAQAPRDVLIVDCPEVAAQAPEALDATEVQALETLETEAPADEAQAPEAPAEVAAEAPAAQAPTDAAVAHAQIIAAWNTRVAAARQCDPKQSAFIGEQRDKWSLALTETLVRYDVNIASLCYAIESHDAIGSGATVRFVKRSGDGFCAKYAVEKVRKITQALALKSFAHLDRFTQAILYNVETHNDTGGLSAKSALACQSRSIDYTEMDNQQEIKRLGNCTSGTANTQRSSTREALRALGMAPVVKARKDDPISLNGSPAALACMSIIQAYKAPRA